MSFTQHTQIGEVVSETYEFYKTLGERLCTIWHLRNDFGTGVVAAMRKMGPWGTDAEPR